MSMFFTNEYTFSDLPMTQSKQELRNIAIIAHVDHGKTTPIDAIRKQSDIFRDNQHVDERVMDPRSGKNAALPFTNRRQLSGKIRVSILLIPPVMKILAVKWNVCLAWQMGLSVTDAAVGPCRKPPVPLKQGLRPIVIINKIDRSDGPDDVVNEVFDLFVALDANDDQLDFPLMLQAEADGVSLIWLMIA